MTDIKLCIDCKWYEANPNSTPAYNLDRCRATQNPILRTSVVTGQPNKATDYCEVNREFSVRCGPEGKWWYPNERLLGAREDYSADRAEPDDGSHGPSREERNAGDQMFSRPFLNVSDNK